TAASLTIDKANSVKTVTCPANVTHKGAAQEPCTANVPRAGGLSHAVTVSYKNNAEHGNTAAHGSVCGVKKQNRGKRSKNITNHNGSNDSKNFTIDKAASVTTVNCPTNVIYNGSAQEPCTVGVTGAGGLNLTHTPTYSNNVNAGTATASYTFAGDANHTGSSDSKNFAIDKAASITTVSCPPNVTYNGSAQEPCTVGVTGAGGLNLTPTLTYSNNVNAGT